MVTVAEGARAAAEYYAALEARQNKAKKGDRDKFRSSLAWRRTRYAALAANATKNSGKPKCELCGRSADDGVKLHVDHILPISTDEGWKKRLDLRALRVACDDCNVGRLATPIEAEGWSLDENMQRVGVGQNSGS